MSHPGETNRTLVLMRHAKSDWPSGLDDEQRPLALRGCREAPEAARWLAGKLPGGVDLVVCSTALRARQTWELMSTELAPEPVVRFDEKVYAASKRTLRSIVGELPDDVRVVILLGHNPGIEDLVGELTGQRRAFRTSSIAILGWDGPWALDGPVKAAVQGRWR
jgi:phosphohistidine phosphatase